MDVHIILYVQDQELSTRFYSRVLNSTPTLNVPGMTEFTLPNGTILGLMPQQGIKRLLGDKIPDPESARGIPRAEIYLRVSNAHAFYSRAIEAGARELSEMKMRDWGDLAAYALDLDGHVIAFAQTTS